MATCKDCFHYDNCSDWIPPNELLQAIKPKGCKHFKNKADVVEVIRCKNCIKHGTDDCIVNRKRDLMRHRTTTKAVGFCSEGERKVVTDKNVGSK